MPGKPFLRVALPSGGGEAGGVEPGCLVAGEARPPAEMAPCRGVSSREESPQGLEPAALAEGRPVGAD